MLLYFEVGGFYSFAEKQALYLTPAKGTRIKGTKYETNFASQNSEKVMKSVVLFGANASGKTNFLLAIKKLCDIALQGLRLPDDFISKECNHQTQTMSFAIELLHQNGDIYYYELAYNAEAIVSEQLTVNDEIIYFYENEKLTTKNDRLPIELVNFLSKRATEPIFQKLRDEKIVEIDEFKKMITKFHFETHSILNVGDKAVNFRINETKKASLEQQKEKVLALMKFIDYRICNFYFEKFAITDEQVVYQIYFEREQSNAKFYLGNESEGIKKMMHLMEQLLNIQAGGIVVIDELDSQISTNTLLEIFNDFIHTSENQTGQVIVSTHNLLLLDQNIFQKQQMYIVNKRADLSSELYSLAEFEVRTETTQLYKAYMKGKFGGING
ncbi:MAG: AAA family ATPase [Culicoidibacterales bacterium]